MWAFYDALGVEIENISDNYSTDALGYATITVTAEDGSKDFYIIEFTEDTLSQYIVAKELTAFGVSLPASAGFNLASVFVQADNSDYTTVPYGHGVSIVAGAKAGGAEVADVVAAAMTHWAGWEDAATGHLANGLKAAGVPASEYTDAIMDYLLDNLTIFNANVAMTVDVDTNEVALEVSSGGAFANNTLGDCLDALIGKGVTGYDMEWTCSNGTSNYNTVGAIGSQTSASFAGGNWTAMISDCAGGSGLVWDGSITLHCTGGVDVVYDFTVE